VRYGRNKLSTAFSGKPEGLKSSVLGNRRA